MSGPIAGHRLFYSIHDEAERLGGFKIDRQFVLGWRLHGEISGLLVLENAIDIAGSAPCLVGHLAPRLVEPKHHLGRTHEPQSHQKYRHHHDHIYDGHRIDRIDRPHTAGEHVIVERDNECL